jgi:putative membrane-bound dehydrogenase-like protein
VCFSQLHALALVDMDADGVMDVVTGKRWWAHSSHDAGSLEPPVLYWFRIVRGDKGVQFVPYQIDDDSGVGTQVVVDDLNGDKLPDIVVGSKRGIFVFTHRTKAIDEAAWQDLQPERRFEPQPVSTALVEAPGEDEPGVAAVDAEGRALNLDFETGDLADWTADGAAFAGLPVRGDTVHARRGDMVSGHAGEWWVGTYEVDQDLPKGTLTSKSFQATHPYASFLVGGGALSGTRVELVDQESGTAIFTAHGANDEKMRRVAADLREHQGKMIYVRLVDDESGGWGHINFDDFQFHDAQVASAEPPVVRPIPPRADDYRYAKLPADEAAAAMRLPEGFRASVFAAEPDVKQPIAMALDDRGRVWIAEAYEYPLRARGDKGRDRILIFTDTNGDGRFDERQVFAEGLNLVSGLEVGFGGVWVGAAPYFMFIPDRNGDDVPDGKPEILLDGWGYEDTHETLNSFIWGPDGWLYGCHGVFTHSRVGKPGTPDNERQPLNAAIWRYHPTRHVFEVFAHGTSNPWGVDFDDHGQAFCTACVIPHLYHVIQGARYERQAGEHFNRHTYDDIKTIADHLHYVGDWPHSGNGRSDSAGGGHAHRGAMIYLGGAWPAEYRGKLFMNNIHGQRLNVDSLHRQGSGFVGKHEPDFLLTQDRASQMISLQYGPDGQMFVIDWYDMQACHDTNASVHDRSNGRIYRVYGGEQKSITPPVDLARGTDAQLAEHVLNQNDWFVRHSRRILQERAAAGTLDPEVRQRFAEIVMTNADHSRRLRAMWALHVTGGLPAELCEALLNDISEYVRAWTIQLALDAPEDAQGRAVVVAQLASLAAKDSSPVVRLYIASALQRLPLALRWDAMAALLAHGDATDHNLSLMAWYAAEPLVAAEPQRAIALAAATHASSPRVAEFVFRRVANLGTPEALDALAASADNADEMVQLAILKGIRDGLRGRRRVEPPPSWAAVYARLAESPSVLVRNEAAAVGVTFGDAKSMAALRARLGSKSVPPEARRAALEALLAAQDPELAPALLTLLGDAAMRESALRGLAAYDNPAIAAAVIEAYPNLPLAEQRIALATLASRPAFAMALLEAVGAKQIAAADLSADLIRQLGNLKNPEVDRLTADVWGQVRSTPADKLETMAAMKKLLDSQRDEPDLELGRAVFARTCQQCHTLYGAGAKIGPDLTGSNRANLDYLLSNIVDPNALIAKEYLQTVILTLGGRVISGILTAEDANSVTIQSATELLVLPKDEIDERSLSDISLMPENQLAQYSEEDIVALVAYLQHPSQVPMLATEHTASLLFNGQDLAGWQGDPALWSVENGEIVGRSSGIDKNSFLLSDLTVGDFRLTVEAKLVDNAGNSGVQFRTKPLEGFHEVRGLQADMGVGWWGKLYDENGRALLWDKSGEQHVNIGDWNTYVIEADGSHVRTWINGQPCVDLQDKDGPLRGQIALQIHSGPPMEVRFRNLKLETLPEAK